MGQVDCDSYLSMIISEWSQALFGVAAQLTAGIYGIAGNHPVNQDKKTG